MCLPERDGKPDFTCVSYSSYVELVFTGVHFIGKI